MRHFAPLRWAAEHFESDSQNVAGIFSHTSVVQATRFSLSIGREVRWEGCLSASQSVWTRLGMGENVQKSNDYSVTHPVSRKVSFLEFSVSNCCLLQYRRSWLETLQLTLWVALYARVVFHIMAHVWRPEFFPDF